MTRPEQKRAERALLQHILSRLNLRCCIIDERERPDFTLQIGKRRVGAELLEYHADQQRRALEEAWFRIRDQLDIARVPYDELGRISVFVQLSSMSLPKTGERTAFVQELIQFVHEAEPSLGAGFVYLKPIPSEWPTLASYARDVRLKRVGCWMHWDSSLEFGGVGISEPELLRLLKNKLNARFEYEADENWLFVIGGTLISQVMGILFVD